MLDEFLLYLKNQKMYSIHTIKNYKIDIDSFYKYLNKEGIKDLDVDYNLIKGYLVKLYEQDLKRNSIARNLSSLRSYYKFLFDNDLIKINPFKYVSMPKKEKKLPKFLENNELEILFNTPNINTPLGQRNRLILEVLYATGIRVSELVNIKIGDVDLYNKEIRILGKGSKERIVFFNDSCLEYIKLLK